MKRLIMDLDDTLTLPRENGSDYSDVMPRQDIVEKVRQYKAQGFVIVISTSRNMRTYNNSIGHINANTLPKIINWLTLHNIPYDEIYVGKAWCGTEGFYVDDKAIRPDEFAKLSYEEIQQLLKING